jgi:hypothetical protein
MTPKEHQDFQRVMRQLADFARTRRSGRPTSRRIVRRRILLALARLGPLKLTIVRGWAGGTDEQFDAVLKALREEGKIVMLGERRGARYGLAWA